MMMTNRTLIVLIGLLVHTGTTYAQGPLTPPGAPAPTMKTLDQIESRVAITNLPYEITVAGSYYLTGNLSTTGHGIIVRADGVTIDLNGYTLTGNLSTDRRGVLIEKTGTNTIGGVTVINGRIEQFHSGLYIGRGAGCLFERLVLSSNAVEGVLARYGEGHRFRDLSIMDNGAVGIYLYSEGGTSRDHLIERCTILRNGSVGIAAECFAGGRISGLRIQEVLVGDHPQYGIAFISDTGQVNGNTIENSVVSDSGTYGILISSAGSASANSIANCVIENTTDDGIGLVGSCRGNSITDCRLVGNAFGIRLLVDGNSAAGNQIEGCTITGSSATGIELRADGTGTVHSTRIQHNTLSHNARGIHLLARQEGRVSGNLIGHTTVSDNALHGIFLEGRNDSETAGNLVESCTVAENGFNGVTLRSFESAKMIGNVVRDNVVVNNAVGLVVGLSDTSTLANNIIERNRVFGNPFEGILVDNGVRNLIVQNAADLYNVTSGQNTRGPTVPDLGVLSTNGNPAHPWANFVPLVE
jgi:parallel beta-helix repeat protein